MKLILIKCQQQFKSNRWVPLRTMRMETSLQRPPIGLATKIRSASRCAKSMQKIRLLSRITQLQRLLVLIQCRIRILLGSRCVTSTMEIQTAKLQIASLEAHQSTTLKRITAWTVSCSTTRCPIWVQCCTSSLTEKQKRSNSASEWATTTR